MVCHTLEQVDHQPKRIHPSASNCCLTTPRPKYQMATCCASLAWSPHGVQYAYSIPPTTPLCAYQKKGPVPVRTTPLDCLLFDGFFCGKKKKGLFFFFKVFEKKKALHNKIINAFSVGSSGRETPRFFGDRPTSDAGGDRPTNRKQPTAGDAQRERRRPGATDRPRSVCIPYNIVSLLLIFLLQAKRRCRSHHTTDYYYSSAPDTTTSKTRILPNSTVRVAQHRGYLADKLVAKVEHVGALNGGVHRYALVPPARRVSDRVMHVCCLHLRHGAVHAEGRRSSSRSYGRPIQRQMLSQ